MIFRRHTFVQQRPEALDELLRRYLPPMEAHLVLRRNMQPQDAADLVQDFVANKILERDLVARADTPGMSCTFKSAS